MSNGDCCLTAALTTASFTESSCVSIAMGGRLSRCMLRRVRLPKRSRDTLGRKRLRRGPDVRRPNCDD